MAKISTKDWRKLPVKDWNVSTFHAFLIDKNKEEYGVDYVPFGKGPISKRWTTEKGQLKQAITKYGPEVVLSFINTAFENHKFNPEFPTLSFGFMYAYMRNDLQRAQVDYHKRVERAKAIEEAEAQSEDVSDDWF
jgi:hypothetical protein